MWYSLHLSNLLSFKSWKRLILHVVQVTILSECMIWYFQVILVGAGTRVPKVQEKLSEIVGMELGKSINTDEAAAMGAVYKAADLSNGFKVKKFLTKDAVLFPIQVNHIFAMSAWKYC
jgi:sugar (pentulose or hexulose) kinase